LVERPFDEGVLRAWLPDDRVLEAAADAVRFRDAGGEDVRVAMVHSLG
jgi:hypothetical protein